MKGKIVFCYEDEHNPYNYEVDLDDEYGYCITIQTTPETKVDYDVSMSNDLRESISYKIDFIDDPNEKEIFTKFKGHELGLLKNAEYIQFDFDYEDMEQYVKTNPFLCHKKIILSEIVDFDLQKLENLQKMFAGKTDNLFFSLSGNCHLVGFQECFDTYKELENLSNHINNLGLSPIEKIMYAYDIVRSKIYVEVDENDDKLKSRELSSALLGDKIVCVGYSRIFKALLKKLNITARECQLHSENNSGHARNEIYLKDEKYDIDGIYYFDTTWDSKKNSTDNSYLHSYKFFAKTKEQMNKLEGNIYTDESLPCFSSNIMWEFEDIVQNKGLDKVPKKMLQTINAMSNRVKGDSLINILYTIPTSPFYRKIDLDKTTSDLYEIADYYDRPLSANTLLQVLYNVRKLEYYEDPNKFPFSLDSFLEIVFNSCWNFDGPLEEETQCQISPRERLKVQRNQIISYATETGLYRNMEQVKLAKVLRKVYENKKNNGGK